MRLHMFTHKSFYTQKLLHKEAFTHRKLLHAGTFTQRTFTQGHFYRDNFTYRSFYTETLVRIDWQQNAQSTSQYYFVLQHFHKALPSTTLYYKYNGHFQLQAWKQWLIKHVKKCENCEKKTFWKCAWNKMWKMHFKHVKKVWKMVDNVENRKLHVFICFLI